MPKANTARARLPRGTKPVIQAFFEALEVIPEGQRAEVAKAAHAGIRDALKAQREKARQEKAREKAAGARVSKGGRSKSAATVRGTGNTATRARKPGRRPASGTSRESVAMARDNELLEET